MAKKAEQNRKEILDDDVINILLKDRTTGENIIWATDDYLDYGLQYQSHCQITLDCLTDGVRQVIKPRVLKKDEQKIHRSKEKAEVFTPSWVCNIQNNLVDRAWAESKKGVAFNSERGKTWHTNYARPNNDKDRIRFPNKPGKTWKDYVLSNRLEISCGEAPYLTSRYDTVTGDYIAPRNRIGLLDRKLRVIAENTPNAALWLLWAEKATKSIYGFEWQGDNILLARENILLSIIEYYEDCFNTIPKKDRILKLAEIISWNIWQMDGIKCVIPNSCKPFFKQDDFGREIQCPCPGCKTGNKEKHTGIYSIIKDWDEKNTVRFIDVLKGEPS